MNLDQYLLSFLTFCDLTEWFDKMQISRHDKKKSLASRMRHYVDFQAKTEVSDGEGGFTENWVNISGAEGIPVEISPIRADRRAEMRSWNVVATHYIRSRSNITIDEVGRVVFGDRYFYVKTLEDIQTLDIEQFMITEERRP